MYQTIYFDTFTKIALSLVALRVKKNKKKNKKNIAFECIKVYNKSTLNVSN